MADQTLVLVVAVALTFIVIVIGELVWLRNRRLKKGMSSGGRVKKMSLRDDAHNALITGRAIVRTLERGGASMEAAMNRLEEAKMAFDRGNFRTCIDIVDNA